jgi:hypothetical protein
MSGAPDPWSLHPGLRTRFLSAGEAIAWSPAPAPSPTARPGRIAALREEEARVEEWGSVAEGGVAVDSGPLGALVLVLAVLRRGPPGALGARHAGRDPAFPAGAIVALWGPGDVPTDERPRPRDVIDLARYALE